MKCICSKCAQQRETVQRQKTTMAYQKIWFLIYPAQSFPLLEPHFFNYNMSRLLMPKNFITFKFCCYSEHTPFIKDLKLKIKQAVEYKHTELLDMSSHVFLKATLLGVSTRKYSQKI